MTTTQGSSKKRRNWSVEDKLNIIRKHFNKSKLIETCDEFRVHPNMISHWWKMILEAGKEALSGQTKREQSSKEKLLKNYEKELAKKNEIIAELSQELLELKKKTEWSSIEKGQASPEIRDKIVDEILRLKKLTGLSESKLLFFIGVNKQRFIEWKDCYGNPPVKRNVPKSHWATETEIMAVIEFKKANIEEGYKRLTWMMVDTNIVYLSPSTVYRILVRASLNNRWTKPTCEPKKRGFEQPVRLHEHWHTDISYINFKGTFLYLICVLDGFSRAILKWDIRESMESFDVIIVLWGACCDWVFETENKPRIISDNGSQFISYEFKEALRDSGLTHSRTSVNHPQSNGKIERFHGTAKQESLRNMPKFSIEQVKKEFGEWIDFYNTKRLHSAINYVAPFDVINGNRELILAERKRKLEIGKENRRLFFQDLL